MLDLHLSISCIILSEFLKRSLVIFPSSKFTIHLWVTPAQTIICWKGQEFFLWKVIDDERRFSKLQSKTKKSNSCSQQKKHVNIIEESSATINHIYHVCPFPINHGWNTYRENLQPTTRLLSTAEAGSQLVLTHLEQILQSKFKMVSFFPSFPGKNAKHIIVKPTAQRNYVQYTEKHSDPPGPIAAQGNIRAPWVSEVPILFVCGDGNNNWYPSSHNQLVVSTPSKNISQNGNLPPSRAENETYLKPPPK